MREVDERYATINKAREEIEAIRENCSHESWREGLHVDEYLPTNTRHGAICNVCDKFLGDIDRTVNQWVEKFNDDYARREYPKKIGTVYPKCKLEFQSDSTDLISKSQFKEMIEGAVPALMKKQHSYL